MSKNIEKLLIKVSKHYTQYIQHKCLVNLMNDLCINYGFKKSSPSATYIFENKIDDKSLSLEIRINKNVLTFSFSILQYHSDHNNDFLSVTPTLIKSYNFLINSDNDNENKRIFIMTSKDDLDNLEMVRVLGIMKEDIFKYVKENFPELNNVIRKKKLGKLLDD